jgi:hypothetical protein
MTGVSPAIETKILSWLLEDDKLDPKYVDNDTYIEVANGNGIRGEARRLAAHLASRGFKISRITNALSFDHLTTKILFSRANLDVVHQLFDGLAYKIDEQDLVEQKRMGDLIRIVVGKDMALVETPSDSLNTALALAKN